MTNSPERIQRNVLATAERRLLTTLCSRMPGWTTPDHLTGLGIFGALMIFGGYVASAWAVAWLWLAIFGYVVHWFGDSMDGSLARFRRLERPNYGYFLDHSCPRIARRAKPQRQADQPQTPRSASPRILAHPVLRLMADRKPHFGLLAAVSLALSSPHLVSW